MRYLLKRGKLYHEGNEYLRYRIEYPFFEEHEKISAFFESVAKNCEEYCRQKLYAAAVEKRERYSYELICRVTHLDRDALSVMMGVRLLEDRMPVLRWRSAESWDLHSGLMMPSSLLVKRYGKKGKRAKKGEKYALCDGRLTSVEELVPRDE